MKFIQRDPLFGDIVVLKAYVVGVLPLTTKKKPQHLCTCSHKNWKTWVSTCKEGFNLWKQH